MHYKSKYRTDAERAAAKREQNRQATARRKAKRQSAAGILPLWKAVAVIATAMDGGASFADAYEALNEVLHAQGMKIRADIR